MGRSGSPVCTSGSQLEKEGGEGGRRRGILCCWNSGKARMIHGDTSSTCFASVSNFYAAGSTRRGEVERPCMFHLFQSFYQHVLALSHLPLCLIVKKEKDGGTFIQSLKDTWTVFLQFCQTLNKTPGCMTERSYANSSWDIALLCVVLNFKLTPVCFKRRINQKQQHARCFKTCADSCLHWCHLFRRQT